MRFNKHILAALMTTISCSSVADIIGYTGSTPQSEPRAVALGTEWMNISNDMTINVSAGLERKIRVVILDSNDNEVRNIETEMVSGSDTFTLFGREYFGKAVEVGSLSDGTYRVEADILDSAGNTVKTSSDNISIDTVAPIASGEFNWSKRGQYIRKHTDGQYIGSYSEMTYIGFNDVVDDLSGISEVRFTSKYAEGPKEGEVHFEGVGNYHADLKFANVSDGSRWGVTYAFVPDENIEMTFIYTISDKAGNLTTRSTNVYIANNRDFDEPTPWAVYTGNGNYDGFEGYEKYVAGMELPANPVTMIYRMPAEQMVGEDPYGAIYGAWIVTGHQYDDRSYFMREDGEHVYFKTESSSNGEGYDSDAYFLGSPRLNRAQVFKHDFTISDPALMPPANITISGYIDEMDTWIGKMHYIGTDFTNGETYHITKLRIEADPRPYDQRAPFAFTAYEGDFGRDTGINRYGFECTIPAGDTSCKIDTNLPYPNDDADIYTTDVLVRNPTGELRYRSERVYWRYSGDVPQLVSKNLADGNILNLTLSTKDTKAAWESWRLSAADLLLFNKTTNEEIVFSGETLSDRVVVDEMYYEYAYDLSKLPDGIYDISVNMVAKHSGENDSSVTNNVQLYSDLQIDTTPPIVTYKGF